MWANLAQIPADQVIDADGAMTSALLEHDADADNEEIGTFSDAQSLLKALKQ